MDELIADPNVWKAVSAASSDHLPTTGSPVFYFPNLHWVASSGRGRVPQPPQPFQPARIPAVVSRMELRARGDDPYIRYTLVPGDQPPPGQHMNAEEQLLPGFDEGVVVYQKQLSASDASKKECFLPKNLVEGLLPPLPDLPRRPHDKSSSHPLNLRGIHGEDFQLTRKFVFRSEKHYLAGSDWRALTDVKEGDFIVFARTGPQRLVFGMRRLQRGAWVTQQRVAAAFQGAQENREFEVDFFPGRGSPEYVVLRGHVDRSLMWDVGSPVRFRKSDEQGQVGWMDGEIRLVHNNRHVGRFFTVEAGNRTFTDVLPWNLGPPLVEHD